VVKLVLHPGADPEDVADRVRSAVRSTLGPVEIDFEFPADILGSGDQKFRAQVCLLPQAVSPRGLGGSRA